MAYAGAWLLHTRNAHALASTDTIVLADFANDTGEPIFDHTLRQGLAVQLEQSPFLGIISEDRIQQTLRLMEKEPNSKLSPPIARDVCQRTGSKVYISGSIASLGSQYVLGLSAVNCGSGDSLAQEQVTAEGKEYVLKALDGAAVKLRMKLGESLNTVQKYETPIEQATTQSLEALQAFSLGWNTLVSKSDSANAVPFFIKAVTLDPNFAMGHALLAISYGNLGAETKGADEMQRAYDLRENVSYREKLFLEAHYHSSVSGNVQSLCKRRSCLNTPTPEIGRRTMNSAQPTCCWDSMIRLWSNLRRRFG